MRHPLLLPLALLVALAGCAATPAPSAGGTVVQASTTGGALRLDPTARYWFDPAVPLGHPPMDSLRNSNGSPRVTDPALYERFWRELAPVVLLRVSDARIRINPNFVAALMAKESGYDPRATSNVPANGITQMTHIADLDLRLIARDSPAWHWMYDEVDGWPRNPLVHDSLARKPRTDSLLADGSITPRTEYLFDPKLNIAASVYWLRLLGSVWTQDVWPGVYGTMARNKLNGGRPVSEQDLLALVTVSYNQGHPYVAGLVSRYGRDWTSHLNEESSDYLERIVTYTGIFQRAARGR